MSNEEIISYLSTRLDKMEGRIYDLSTDVSAIKTQGKWWAAIIAGGFTLAAAIISAGGS